MKIMMVCLGNICRSPLAHGILEYKVKENNLDWVVESSGTSSWHVGEAPDRRSIEVAQVNGIDITQQRSMLFSSHMLKEYDLIIAMDSSNYNSIISMAENDSEKAKASLLMNYAYPGENRQVPDPYYTGSFQVVFDMIDDAVNNLIKKHA